MFNVSFAAAEYTGVCVCVRVCLCSNTMRAVELDGADPFKNMTPEFGIRFRAAQCHEHAPGDLCKCQNRDGVKGTYVLRPFLIEPRFYGWKEHVMKQVWCDFDGLDITSKRMSCHGAGQTEDGDWRHFPSMVPIAAHIKAVRARKLQALAWRHIPMAIWFVFRLMEGAAKRAEEARLARIRTALERQDGAEISVNELMDAVLAL